MPRVALRDELFSDTNMWLIDESCKLPIIDDDETTNALILRAKQGDKFAESIIIDSNSRLVISIAKRYIPVFDERFTDLVQEGKLGILRAIELFDFSRGFKFSTYAVQWIKQRITRWINNTNRDIHIPNYMIEKHRKVSGYRTSYFKKYGTFPTNREITEATKLPEEKIVQLDTIFQPMVSTEDFIYGDDESGLTAQDTREFSTSDEYDERADQRIVLNEILKTVLSPSEYHIILRRFKYGEKLEQIGKGMHLTRERVRQLEKRALNKLRMSTDSSFFEF